MKAPERIDSEKYETIKEYLESLFKDADCIMIRKEWWDDIQDYAYVSHRVYLNKQAGD